LACRAVWFYIGCEDFFLTLNNRFVRKGISAVGHVSMDF
jgi:hypothetical protein